MLRKIRITLATIFFVLITLLFLDFTGTLQAWFGWLAKIQFLPSLLALNIFVIIALIAFTLLFGRVYCSVICPMGVFQDVISWVSNKTKKNRFRYSPALNWVRWGVLAIFVAAFVAGISSFVALISPYSAYGRIASNLFAPFYQWGNNLLAYFAERINSYAFYSVDVWLKGLPTFIIAIATFVVIITLAWRNGRTYCNTVCPVGTVLGFLSKYSFYRPQIDLAKCNNCGLCARNCKASCIDSKSHKIDYSRCVTCMNCIEKCNKGAIQYIPVHKTQAVEQSPEDVNTSRRKFVSLTALLTLTSVLEAQQKKVDGGLAAIEEKKVPKRNTPITPAGSSSGNNMNKHCTGCQLCVSVCPNQVLRPSSSLTTLMQPEMSYERGYCRPECTKCSEVCPTGAIHKITQAEKTATQIGHAVWIKANCVVNTNKVSCGNCARHCTNGAIQMVAIDATKSDSLKIPAINSERCIGCGACENLCPARPFSAIYVEGHEMHKSI